MSTGYWFFLRGLLQGGGAPTEAPAAPTDLVATALSHKAVRLEWVDASDNESEFEIQQAPDDTGSPGAWTTIATAPENATAYTVTGGMTPETPYWFQVRAVNVAGESDYATPDTATTLAASSGAGDNTARRRRRARGAIR